MPDAHANLAITAVVTAPSPAASGTELVVTTGQGSYFPATPFNATVWPADTNPTPLNAEIVRVTDITDDTLTITRAQEGTSARTIIATDQIADTITAKSLTDIEGDLATLESTVDGMNDEVYVQLAEPSAPADASRAVWYPTFSGLLAFVDFRELDDGNLSSLLVETNGGGSRDPLTIAETTGVGVAVSGVIEDGTLTHPVGSSEVRNILRLDVGSISGTWQVIVGLGPIRDNDTPLGVGEDCKTNITYTNADEGGDGYVLHCGTFELATAGLGSGNASYLQVGRDDAGVATVSFVPPAIGLFPGNRLVQAGDRMGLKSEGGDAFKGYLNGVELCSITGDDTYDPEDLGIVAIPINSFDGDTWRTSVQWVAVTTGDHFDPDTDLLPPHRYNGSEWVPIGDWNSDKAKRWHTHTASETDYTVTNAGDWKTSPAKVSSALLELSKRNRPVPFVVSGDVDVTTLTAAVSGVSAGVTFALGHPSFTTTGIDLIGSVLPGGTVTNGSGPGLYIWGGSSFTFDRAIAADETLYFGSGLVIDEDSNTLGRLAPFGGSVALDFGGGEQIYLASTAISSQAVFTGEFDNNLSAVSEDPLEDVLQAVDDLVLGGSSPSALNLAAFNMYLPSVGGYLSAPGITGYDSSQTPSSTTANSTNIIRPMPLNVPVGMGFDEVVFEIGTAATDAGARTEIGICPALSTTGLPDIGDITLLGEAAITTTGVKTISLSPNLELEAGLYWALLCFRTDGTTAGTNPSYRGVFTYTGGAMSTGNTVFAYANVARTANGAVTSASAVNVGVTSLNPGVPKIQFKVAEYL